MIDNHVHVGWYSDGYHSPNEIWSAELSAGVDNIVVSSTSTCAELYKQVVKEMRELIRLGDSCVHPVLWLTPRMMRTWGIRFMLHSKIRWQGIKMHWHAHREWYYDKRLTKSALEIARQIRVPVLVHTGYDKECRAINFLPWCREYEDLTFILAHGRPINEALEVIKNCPNALADTSFMTPNDVLKIVEAGYENRVLFGTDAPINRLYVKNKDTVQFIKGCYLALQESLSKPAFDSIMRNQIYF